MSRYNNMGRLALALVACTPALLADGAQTGSITGLVRDQKGAPVAGAQIRVTSPNLIGTRTFTTGSTGEFRALLLPPGQSYTVTVSANGFQVVNLPTKVQVNQPTSLSVTLPTLNAAVVEVIASSTTLDTNTVSAQTNYNKEVIDRLPVGRTYQDMMGLTAGIQAGGNPAALGGKSSENLYLVDGVDTTDPTTGTFGLNLNEEAIEEVQVLTTGVSAEYGRFNGAVSNVVTKSGSNEFSGSFRYDMSNVGWNANKPKTATPALNLVKTPFLTLSGPIIKDKVWFFLSAQVPSTSGVQTTTGRLNEAGIPFDRTFKADPSWYSAKITWQISQNHAVVFQATGDPAKINAVQYGVTTDLDTLTTQKQGGNFLSLSYRATLTENMTFETKLAKQNSEIIVSGHGGQKWIFYDQTDAGGRQYENGPFEGYVKRPRTQFNANLTWFPQAAGQHEVKIGLDNQETKSKNKFGAIGDAEVYFDGFATQTDVTNLNYNMDPASSFIAVYSHPLESSSSNKYTAFYVNDKWKLNNHWNFNIGGRYEKVKGTNDLGEQIWDFSSFSPRLGATYDWVGDSKQNVGLYFARYYLSPWQDGLDSQNKLSQSYELFGYIAGDPHLRGSFDSVPFYSNFPSVNPYLQFDKNLKASHVDEWTLGVKRQISEKLTYQGQVVYRNFKDPLVNEVYYSGVTSDTRTTYLTNEADARRTYRGLLNTVEYNGDKWYFMGTWTMSSIMGDIDASDANASYGRFFKGTYVPTNQFNMNSASLPPINQNRSYGYLGNDQTHVVRTFAARKYSITPTFNIDSGFRLAYFSGFVYSIAGVRADSTAPAYVNSGDRNFTQYFGQRGMFRQPDYWRLDYTATFNFQIWKKIGTSLKVQLSNVLNTFRPETYTTTASYLNPTSATVAGSFRPGSTFGKSISGGNYQNGRRVDLTWVLRF